MVFKDWPGDGSYRDARPKSVRRSRLKLILTAGACRLVVDRRNGVLGFLSGSAARTTEPKTYAEHVVAGFSPRSISN